MRQSSVSIAYAWLVFAADQFAKIPVAFFALLAMIHANYWITKLVYRIVLAVMHLLIALHVPADYIMLAKRYAAWTREWSYTKPSDWLYANYRYYQMQNRVDVVMAHYKEDLSWVTPYLGKIDHLYLYCKDKDACLKGLSSDLHGAKLVVKYLPNEGREANTYLQHILGHYAYMADRTVFTMASMNGNWMRHLSFLFALTESSTPRQYCYSDAVFEKLRAFQFSLPDARPTSLGDGYDKSHVSVSLSAIKPLHQWIKHYLPVDVFAGKCRFGDGQHGAIFSVTKQAVQKYPKQVYHNLLQANSGADSMEAGYYMERIWRFMFAVSIAV